MNDERLDVYGLGQCSLDYIGTIERYPAVDSKCEFRDMVVEGGGPVATAMVALARWGFATSFCGVIGDDYFGDEIRRSLEGEGIRLGKLIERENSRSQFAFIVAEPATGSRTVFWRRPTGPSVEPDELDGAAIQKSRVFYTDGFFERASLAGARRAREAGVRVVVDAGSMREGMLDLLSLSDCFIASQSFANAYAGAKHPADICRELSSRGPAVAGITLGANGYVAFANGEAIAKPAYDVRAIDSTGCGDVFHAGFVCGFLNGWDAEESLDFGAWAAAMVCRKPGGRKGIPTLAGWEKARSGVRNEGE
jgi:sulfofructose kinase